MELGYLKTLPQGGFNFDNCIRNKALTEAGSGMATQVKTMKTGTTICGVIYKVTTYQQQLHMCVGWRCACR